MLNHLAYVTDSSEPVTVDEAKLASRIDTDDLDALIAGFITAARESAEHITGRKYRLQVLREERVDWPCTDERLPVFQPTACVVRTWNGTDWTVLDASAYEFAADSLTGTRTVLAPVPGTSWPDLVERAVGPRVQIDLTAGPDDPAAVPEQVKLYIKAQVAAWIANPEAAQAKSLAVSPLYERLLDEQKLYG